MMRFPWCRYADLERPNPDRHWFDVVWFWETSLLLYGSAYLWELAGADGAITDVYNIPTPWVFAKADRTFMVHPHGQSDRCVEIPLKVATLE